MRLFAVRLALIWLDAARAAVRLVGDAIEDGWPT